jgi:hypothetical protein
VAVAGSWGLGATVHLEGGGAADTNTAGTSWILRKEHRERKAQVRWPSWILGKERRERRSQVRWPEWDLVEEVPGRRAMGRRPGREEGVGPPRLGEEATLGCCAGKAGVGLPRHG